MRIPIRALHIFGIMDRGGAETMIMNYYRSIDKSTVQFDFLVLRPERGAYEDEIESMGGNVFRVPPIFSYFAHKQAVKQFFKEHPEYTIIHGHIGELGYYIYKEAKHNGIKNIIVHAHNAACDHDWKWPFRQLLKFLCRPLVGIPMTCGIDAAKWQFGKKIATRAIMLNNAIESSKFTYNETLRHRIREDMGWQGKYVIGNVGRFNPQKNHMGLIHIFKDILKQKSDALLVLIGDKTFDYPQVKQLAQKLEIQGNIHFLGSRSDVHELLQGMDVYCAPSLYEGLSVSMVEAQAAGLKIITSTNVPKQVAICKDLVEFIPLTAPYETWSGRVLYPYTRRNTYKEICSAGFDINENIAKLENFYLSLN